MEIFLGFFCSYLVCVIISVFVMRVRAGVGVWHRLKVLGPDGFGVGWVASVVVASMFWPITLALWLFRGRPEPRTVFNEKALERHGREQW